MIRKALLITVAAGLVLSPAMSGIPAKGGRTDSVQYADKLYELYLESLEKARANYLEVVKASMAMNEKRSPWIDSACARIGEINRILGDRNDSLDCAAVRKKAVEKK